VSSAGGAAVGFAVGGVGALLATPLAIRLARRLDFFDRPREYRQHGAPTPFLGGAAVLLAFLVAATATGDLSWRWLVVMGLAIGMWVIGTTDDAIAVPPKWRLLLVSGAAGAVFASGLGWDAAAPGVVDLLLTVVWIVGLVNALNLMDNLEGACGTVAAVSAAGIGALALVKGQPTVAALALALCGSCAGFLPWNLAGPARVFLGDGGSMPVGFLLATLAMAAARRSSAGAAGILVGAMLVGLPILDVALVSLSRSRRGVTLMTGGRDHLTHRILLVARSPRLVAAALAAGQFSLCTVAIVGYGIGSGAVAWFGLAAFLAGLATIAMLDRPRWRPAGIAVAPAVPGITIAATVGDLAVADPPRHLEQAARAIPENRAL
jgi:UDP-GlcNAc:undecaprenyl-phosphate GlcNAc-1-phosphate transferase